MLFLYIIVADDEMKQIYYTMKHIELYTCLRFVFRTESDDNFIYLRNIEGKCQSFVGNVRRGPQVTVSDLFDLRQPRAFDHDPN